MRALIQEVMRVKIRSNSPKLTRITFKAGAVEASPYSGKSLAMRSSVLLDACQHLERNGETDTHQFWQGAIVPE